MLVGKTLADKTLSTIELTEFEGTAADRMELRRGGSPRSSEPLAERS